MAVETTPAMELGWVSCLANAVAASAAVVTSVPSVSFFAPG